ncbi:bactofilin family protein [Caldisalinibacter kiritimatiensis]|uniref:Integral membrane protein CcmA involved in cell shape determination n=1 Tax=Caldisalinibacter kiritimatiensis TaxID=1304284 RepID=R1CD54_9FIRM|nr:polymer-forming cytoskeletal protein [Caldisalinibacter kiritimatiensis]EOD00230.1 protein of unknown function DUF583 [Caldisalinibacter kiritimatiensis]
MTKKNINMMVKKNARLKGTINTSESIEIQGIFKGKIFSNKTVYIEPTAQIDGDIIAENVIIRGNVKGNVTAKAKIHLTSTSKLEGQIIAKRFIIDNGAYFLGQCKRIKPKLAS